MFGSLEKSALQRALFGLGGAFRSVALTSFFINLLMLVPPIYMLQVLDRVFSSRSESTLLMLTLLMVALLLVMGALLWVRSWLLVRISARLDQQLADQLFDAIFARSLRHGGAGSAQPLNDFASLRQFLTGAPLIAFFDAPWIPVFIFVLYLFHPLFALFTVVVALLMLLISIVNQFVTRRPIKEANEYQIIANKFVSDNLRNAEIVHAMGMLPQLRQRWRMVQTRMLAAQGEGSDRGGAVAAVSQTVRITSQSLILALGAYLVLQQELTIGVLIAAKILTGLALAPIDKVISNWRGSIEARAAYDRLNRLLQDTPSTDEAMALPPPKGLVTVERITVAPPGAQRPVIENMSFLLMPGEILGVVGPSGSGKSTLIRALLGVWPVREGVVRLDGADVYGWNRAELGPHIGYLPQDVELFDGTVAENIARFGDVVGEQVVEAAKTAGVHNTILRLPQGYDTRIGVGGGVLSGGQRQRVALARAIYGNPVLVVLDEPNSNLDEEGESALGTTIGLLKERKRTVIIVSHRPRGLARADKILAMQGGKLRLFGPRKQVLEQLAAANPAQSPALAAGSPGSDKGGGKESSTASGGNQGGA